MAAICKKPLALSLANMENSKNSLSSGSIIVLVALGLRTKFHNTRQVMYLK